MAPNDEWLTLADLVEQYQGKDPDYVLLEPASTAHALDVSPKTLEAWRRDANGPPFTKFGRHIRYPLSGLMRFATDHLYTTTREAKGRRRAGVA